jgi:PBP1b-binding outer membrane lipoprotein LpoB
MKKKQLVLGAFLLILTISTSCKKGSIGDQTDFSGYWNDNDVRTVCTALIGDCLASQGVDQAIKAKQGTPKVIVGRFRNDSSEHFDTSIVSSVMEEVVLNSGKLDIVTQDQGNETEAEFLLSGSVKTLIDRDGKQNARTYIVNAEMSNIKTGEYVWMGMNRQIKKTIVRQKTNL